VKQLGENDLEALSGHWPEPRQATTNGTTGRA
jgi:hypothetical protein